MRLLAKSLTTSDDHNFASFAKFRIVPGLKSRKIVTLEGAPLAAEISATLKTQKFLTSQNFSKIFSEKVDFSRFRRSIFSVKGVRVIRNFYLT